MISDEGPGDIVLYSTGEGSQVFQLRATGGTIWLTQLQLADLYGTSTSNVAQIIKRLLEDREVTEATINSELIVRLEGTRAVKRTIKFYNLDMVLAIGYRVTTPRAVQFRQWATTTLKEYLVKGFAMNDEYLKDPDGTDYFDELLRRIRSIRSSEKRFYLKIRDVFKETSADYDGKSSTARTFFATIQNKLLFAVTSHTAAELVLERANPDAPNMGLTSWKGKAILKEDAEIAKNYLKSEELTELERLTTMFLDYIEDRAGRRQQTLMSDWVAATEKFLDFNERPALKGPGRISRDSMQREVAQRYKSFDRQRRHAEATDGMSEEAQDLRSLLEAAEKHSETNGHGKRIG